MTHLIPLSEALGPIRDVYAPPARRGGALAGRPGPPHRPRPLRADLRGGDAGFGREVSPTRWARTDVYHVLRCDIPNWCSLHRCLWPVELPEAMWEWFDFLPSTGRLDPASDPLCGAAQAAAVLRRAGRARAGCGRTTRRAPVECECHLPYRETVQLLNRLGRSASTAAQLGRRGPVGDGTCWCAGMSLWGTSTARIPTAFAPLTSS